jgi:hypothetical protein
MHLEQSGCFFIDMPPLIILMLVLFSWQLVFEILKIKAATREERREFSAVCYCLVFANISLAAWSFWVLK